jgi:hypothetical protein
MEPPRSHLSGFCLAGRTGDVQSIDVQNISYADIPLKMKDVAKGKAFLTNSLAFCPLSRVLSGGGGFNMKET